MRTIFHLSDVHFGKIDRNIVLPLVQAAHELKPNLVVISGDLTQQARRPEFRAARDFLLSMPGPQIVVPGNHDVPIWNPLARFTKPLARFRHFITQDLYPFFEDEEIAALGLNTARSRKTKYGHINPKQLHVIRQKLCPVSRDKIKIIVTHHPFDIPEGYRNTKQIVSKSRRAMSVLSECGTDLFLAGHLHRAFTGHTAERYQIRNYGAVIVQAGTIAMHHTPQQTGYNIIVCDKGMIRVSHFEWSLEEGRFQGGPEQEFVRSETGWKRRSNVSPKLDDEHAEKREQTAAH